MDFKTIIKEAKNKVRELQDEKKSISNNYSLTIKGEEINVGGSIAVGKDITIGSSNAFNENTNLFNSEAIFKTVEDFKKASIAIKDSKELDEEMKSRLLEIMEMAQIGISERSNEKQIQAKKNFASVKSFLINVAPTLIGVLANFATIANFFGLTF